MVATSATAVLPLFSSSYDRASELQAFDDTKAGVKGLVDAGVQKIPQIFVRPPEILDGVKPDTGGSEFRVPVVDLGDQTHHREVVEEVRRASETCGFFQVVNHGIPVGVMEEMLQGLRRFYGQDAEVKKQYYTRDVTRKVVYNSNFDLFSSPAANWRDTFFCFMAPSPPKPEELPDE